MNERGPEFLARIQNHVERYLRTDGEDGGSMGPGSTVLLLTTTGRKSGNPVTVPLTYFQDGDQRVIVASNGGLETSPQWYLNLTAQPQVRVKVMKDTYDAVARTASADERSRIWPALIANYPGYATYQKGIQREIPLVILDPA